MASSISPAMHLAIPPRPRPMRLLDRLSSRQAKMVATAFGLSVFGGACLADSMLGSDRLARKRMRLLSQAAVGAFAGWAVISSARRARAERKAITSRLQMIGELNHHIRNALQSIQLSAYSTHDQQAICVIDGSIARIERVLREVAPAP